MLFGLAIGVVNSLLEWRKTFQLANDANYFTSQKLPLLAHGIATKLSQMALYAKKFDWEIEGEHKKVAFEAILKFS